MDPARGCRASVRSDGCARCRTSSNTSRCGQPSSTSPALRALPARQTDRAAVASPRALAPHRLRAHRPAQRRCPPTRRPRSRQLLLRRRRPRRRCFARSASPIVPRRVQIVDLNPFFDDFLAHLRLTAPALVEHAVGAGDLDVPTFERDVLVRGRALRLRSHPVAPTVQAATARAQIATGLDLAGIGLPRSGVRAHRTVSGSARNAPVRARRAGSRS